MKNRSFLLLSFLIFFSPVISNAQFGAIRKSINKAINKEIGNKIDSAAQKNQTGNATTGGTGDQEASGQGSLATGRGLFGGKIDIKFNETYKFTGRVRMLTEIYDKKDVLTSDYDAYYNDNTKDAGIEVVTRNSKEGEQAIPSVFIFDNENRSLMILISNNGSKSGIISSIPSDSALAAQSKNIKTEEPKVTVVKTGNSKVIAGYKCDEYKVTEQGKDEYSLLWMTKDLKIKADRKYWGKSGMPAYYGYPGFEGAFMLAMETYNKDNKLAMKMETKEIDDNYPHTISTAGYTFMKMNFGQTGKK